LISFFKNGYKSPKLMLLNGINDLVSSKIGPRTGRSFLEL